jgi:hypothetical protein
MVASSTTEIRFDEIESTGFISTEFSLLNRYVMQKLYVVALLSTSYHKQLAEKVKRCHTHFRGRRCLNGHTWASPDNFFRKSCDVPLCPHCSHRRAIAKATEVQAFMVGRVGRYVVLAERNSKTLKAGLKSLFAAWTKLRRSRRWNAKVKGCIAVLEVTRNERAKTWHPHLNILFEGEYFPFKELNQAWQKVTGGNGRTSHIQAANEGTAFELIKYTLKIAELKETPEGKVYDLLITDPQALDEYLASMYCVRTIRTYGTFFGITTSEDEQEGAEDKPEKEVCPDCGEATWIDIGSVHHSQLNFDFAKKVLRIARAPSRRINSMHLDRPPTPRLLGNARAIAASIQSRSRRRSYEGSVLDTLGRSA